MYVLKCCFFFSLLVPSFCANILGLFPAKFKSHFIIYDSIMTELARRGHEVTVVSPFPKSSPVDNFYDIDVNECDQTPLDDVFGMDQAYNNAFTELNIMLRLAEVLESIVQCTPVQQLLTTNKSYDLVITEVFHSDVMAAFANKFNAPLISFSASSLFPWAADRVGEPNNPSYIRYPFGDIPLNQRHPTFYQRLVNTVYHINANLRYHFANSKAQDMAEKHLGLEKPLSEIVKNTSLILTFSHFSVNAPVPHVPNVIEISGVHIRRPSPLPEDLKKFMDESSDGVIYFSMGSLLKMETMPEDKRQAFVDAFAELPQRIVWKWDNESLPGQTDNIFIAKWLPQRDVLAHPNVKLFISHGGALGVNEAVFEGVPILGIPMYADQITNLKVLQSYQAAKILQYTDISKENVLKKIREIFDKDYSSSMKRLSDIYKDRPMPPLDTAIFWIEYVLRHGGAPHLRSWGADLPFYKYLLLDVLASVVSGFFIISLTMAGCSYGIAKGSAYIIRQNVKPQEDEGEEKEDQQSLITQQSEQEEQNTEDGVTTREDEEAGNTQQNETTQETEEQEQNTDEGVTAQENEEAEDTQQNETTQENEEQELTEQ